MLTTALDRAAGARPIGENRVQLLIDGPTTYEVMLDMISRARERIHFENYIIRSDRTGWRFAEALIARAREGVEVRVLYDWLGCVTTRGRLWRSLREAGCEVREFNPPRVLNIFATISRDHRKLIVTDGNRAVTGGLCIGDEWMGDEARGILPWRDTGIEIAGPGATALDAAFTGTWERAGGRVSPVESRSMPALGDATVRIIAGRPGRERAYKVLEMLAASSRERIWITDAYMVPPPRLFTAFVDAAREGVDVRMLVPGSSDVPLVRNLTRIGYRDLLRAGIRIYEWDGPMLHAKTGVADGRWVRIGTSNLNASSLLGNYELDVLIEDRAFALSMEEQYRRDLTHSAEVVRGRLRAPQSLQRVLPSKLARQPPDEPPEHRQSRRERRRRAVVILWTAVTGARRSIYGPLALVLVALGALFLVLPRVMSGVFGVLCVWLAVAAGREAIRRRAEE
ncbi:MAG: phosphatidylserine/phosphatidylglycerophosphate/cardiolipin synthase family protein [Gemmatimonadales bacterium]